MVEFQYSNFVVDPIPSVLIDRIELLLVKIIRQLKCLPLSGTVTFEDLVASMHVRRLK